MTAYVIYLTLAEVQIEIVNIVQTLDEAIEVCKHEGVTMSWNPNKGLMTIKDSKSGYTAYINRVELT